MDLQNEKCVMVIDLREPPLELPFGCMATNICCLALSQIRRLSWESSWEKRCRRLPPPPATASASETEVPC